MEIKTFEGHSLINFDIEIKMLYLHGLALIMEADGEIDNEEKDFFKILLNSFNLDQSNLDDLIDFTKKPDKKVFLEVITLIKDYELVDIFFADSIILSLADGDISDKGMMVLKKYLSMFQLSRDKEDQLLRIIDNANKKEYDSFLSFINKNAYNYIIDYLKSKNIEVSVEKELENQYNQSYFINVDSKFLIGRYLVTQDEYEEIIGDNQSFFEEDHKNPVDSVSWFDAVIFCNKKSLKDGLEPVYTINGESVKIDYSKNGYRLPDSNEWEYAAKGGVLSKGYKYPGSNDPDEVAWYKFNSDGKTHPVGTKKPNELGIYDMGGNVWEWCNDWDSKYSTNKVLRGGSWDEVDDATTVSYCCSDDPADRDCCYATCGFRIIQSL